MTLKRAVYVIFGLAIALAGVAMISGRNIEKQAANAVPSCPP